MARLIHLVRHAPTITPEPGLIVGQQDYPALLPDAGLSQGVPWGADAVWVVSPAQRAQQTARYLGAIAPQSEPRLLEQSHGGWEGYTWEQVLASDTHAQVYLDAFHRTRPPQGESLADVRRRSVQALNHWRSVTDRELILVCHAGPIRCLVAHALGISTETSAMIDIDTLSATTLKDWGGKSLALCRSNQHLT